MTIDLRAALAALGRGAHDDAPPLPIDALITRAHRTRTLHAATYSAIGVGAAAVIAFGAVAADGLRLDRDAAPVPPATEEPRETPTVTPTATPTVAAWEPSWDLCGMPAEDLYDRETAMDWATGDWAGATGWWIESSWPVGMHTVPVDGLLTLIVSVNGQNVAGVTAEAQVTEVVALEMDYTTGAGWVAGVAASPPGDLVQGRVTGDDPIFLGAIETRLVSCDASPLTGGGGALDTSLTGEHYAAYALTDIRPDGGDTVTSVAYVGTIGEYPEDEAAPDTPPTTWTVRDGNATATNLPLNTPYRLAEGWGWSHVFGTVGLEELCGQPATPMPTAWLEEVGGLNGWLGVAPSGMSPFRVSATGFRDEGQLIVQVTTTNNGSAVDDAWIASPGVTVVKDGRIIGYRYMWNTPFAPTTWATGETVQMEFRLGQLTCTFMQGEPWPAGTYEVYVQQNMDVLPQPGYPERWRYDAVGGPFTFTLD